MISNRTYLFLKPLQQIIKAIVFFSHLLNFFTSVNDEHQVPIPHWRWTDCTDSVYTLTIDTFRCERLWPIIVNKYNWQLMVNHIALRRFFPEQMVRAYQWYKDSAAINDATADEYSEQNELHGIYQLLIWMNDDTYAWSNIITITDTPEPQPVIMHIYNSNGIRDKRYFRC